MPLRIEDYALIGDLQTAALVGKDGSIDWLCLPDFDSPACFCALIGKPANGRWKIAPTARVRRINRQYFPGTLVLETTMRTATGSILLTDFMPVRDDNPAIVRVVTGLTGRVQMESELCPRFDYGQSVPWFSMERRTLRAISGPHMIALQCPGKRFTGSPQPVMRFTVAAGETVSFVLNYAPSFKPLPRAISPGRALSSTKTYWQKWISQSRYRGAHKSAVDRSLITLKALTFRPAGGIVAAPTTSLPEQPHGTRNWDYRYCWLRDATFTLTALLRAGFLDEARNWRDWLLRALAGNANQVQIMYGIRGERDIPERQMPWLTGYKRAQPVRDGNAASMQFQLDIYGEVLDAMLRGSRLAHHDKLRANPTRARESLKLICNLVEHLERVWRRPDQGIWEMRSGPRHFTYSKVMAWVAFDRAIKLAERRRAHHLPIARWARLRAVIHAQVCERGFNSSLNSFTQSYGSQQVDASLLFLPMLGFLPIDDPRITGTVAAVERNLLRNGFVMRYDTRKVQDNLPAGEGVFLPCSFWLTQVMVMQGRKAEAEKLMTRLCGLRNDVGLLSEEYDTKRRQLLGNFPQAFSHIALIDAAFALELGDAPIRATTERQQPPRRSTKKL